MKTFQAWSLMLFLCSFQGLTVAQASDTYNSNTGVLSIPLVQVGATFYSNVDISLAAIVSVGSASSNPLSYDTYNSVNNQLSIPTVNVGTVTYSNVVVIVGSVIKVGGTCASLNACSITPTASTPTASTPTASTPTASTPTASTPTASTPTASTPTASTPTASTPTASTPTTSASTLYYTSAPFSSAIQATVTAPTLSAAATLTNRSRYLISDSSTANISANYLQIGATYSATQGYAAETNVLDTSVSYNTYLSKTFQAIADTSGYFRLDSHLQPNNSLDFDVTDGNKLKFRNNFGKAIPTYGYVTFNYDSTNKRLQAKKRYLYTYSSAVAANATSYTGAWNEDTAFSAQNYYVNMAGGSLRLVALATDATKLYFYNSPFDLGIPTFMDPLAFSFVTNAAAPFLSKVTVASVEGTSGNIYKQLSSTYRGQILTPGTDATTKANADAMLASIKSKVEASGEKLRYDTSLYTAFRDRALATKLVSDSIADGTPGQNLVPYVYFTNEQDTSGKYHPFMIVVSYGNQASPNGLKDIPHPPGDGLSEYTTAKVTRFSNLENYTLMIPMKDYGQVSVVTENTFTSNLWLDVPTTTAPANVYTYADRGDNGVLVDGSVMFPVYNNTLIPANLMGELSASGCHVGRGGGGPHCHFDGYQSGLGLGLYNDSDYLNKTHPPLIGFGYDGIALFGTYRSTDSAMLGYGTALDAFGAHNHDGIGYHYHAHTVNNYRPELKPEVTTTLHALMKGAYIGKTNSIPYFRSGASASSNQYLWGTQK